MVNIQTFTEDKISIHQDVAKGTYSSPEVVDAQHIYWKHIQNPFGPSSVITLTGNSSENAIIGRSFLARRDFQINYATIIKGSTVTDLVVMPEYRTAGRLIELVKASKSFHNSMITIHSSNEVSDVFYRKMFKFPVIFSLESAGFPVRLTGYLRNKNVPNFAASLINLVYSPVRWMIHGITPLLKLFSGIKLGRLPTTQELDKIHHGHHSRTGPQFSRNAKYFYWRYIDGPISQSRVYGIFDSDNECIGYFSIRKVSLNGMIFTVLMDIVTEQSMTKLQYLFLKFALMKLTMKNKSEITFAMFNPNHKELNWLGELPFIKVPDSALPHPTPIFVHQHESINKIKDLHKMYFTIADLDYF